MPFKRAARRKNKQVVKLSRDSILNPGPLRGAFVKIAKIQRKWLPLSVIIFCITAGISNAQPYKAFTTFTGTIHFRSDAPEELIGAESSELKGAIETTGKTFSFKVRVASFEGFNSGLQKVHFNDNYVETLNYPEATFKGKIIEDIDWTKDGQYEVRAKGFLNIHGVEQERIIKSNLTIKDGKVLLKCNFTVLLADHNIPIPRIVKEKLAEEIKVEIKATLEGR